MKKLYCILSIILVVTTNSFSQCTSLFVKDTGSVLGITLPSGMYNSAPALVDIDNDGDQDLFVGGKDGTISYFQNNGTPYNPNFTQNMGSSNPFNSVDVVTNSLLAFVDIDNDGDYDAFLGSYDGKVYFYKNTGTITNPIFSSQSSSSNPFNGIDVGYNSSLAFTDIDNDGDFDAFIGSSSVSMVFYKNTGTSSNPIFTLQSGTLNPLNAGVAYYSCINFVDIDKDGDKDCFVGSSTGIIVYLKNTGDSITPAFTYQSNSLNPFRNDTIGTYTIPAFADLDNDSDMDAIIGEYDGTINYYQNTGSITSPNFINFASNFNPVESIDAGDNSTPTFVDIDNDGDLDLFIIEYKYKGKISYYKNIGTSNTPIFSIQTSSSNPFDGLTATSNLAFVDIDEDGDLDAILESDFYENTGSAINPVFKQNTANLYPFDKSYTESYFTFIDIDSDGDMDAFAGNSGGAINFYENTGSSTIPNLTKQSNSLNPFDSVDVGGRNTPTFIDIDNDGDFDALIGEYLGGIYYYKNIGRPDSAIFVLQPDSLNPFSGISVGYNTYPAPTFSDLDNDSDMDLFIGFTNGTILFYQNTGTPMNPIFALPTNSLNPLSLKGANIGYNNAPAFVDIDKDGDLDAFIGEDHGKIIFYENVGTSANPIYIYNNNGSLLNIDVGDNSTPTFVDIDNDGDMDAFIGEYDGTINYYQNTIYQTSTMFVEQTGSANPFNGSNTGYNGSPVDYLSKPSFVDIDNDGDFDAFVGIRYGISYYKNTGTKVKPIFSYQSGSTNPFYNFSNPLSYNAPTFIDFDKDGDFDVFIGNGSGTIDYYANTGNSTTPTFTKQSGTANPCNQIDVNGWSIPTFVDINNDGEMELATGDYASITFFYDYCSPSVITTINDLNNTKTEIAIEVYPNPITQNEFTIELPQEITNGEILIYDLTGNIIIRNKYNSSQTKLDVSSLAKGMYLLQATNENHEIIGTQKIIKH